MLFHTAQIKNWPLLLKKKKKKIFLKSICIIIKTTHSFHFKELCILLLGVGIYLCQKLPWPNDK